MPNDQSEATVAVIALDAEYCSGTVKALTRNPTADGIPAPDSAATRPEIEAPVPSRSERPSISLSCTSISLVASSLPPSLDAVGRGATVSRYQPGGTRAISNVPLPLTTATVDSDPKLPNRRNSRTSMPLADRPERLTTDPVIRAPFTCRSSIWIGTEAYARADTRAAAW